MTTIELDELQGKLDRAITTFETEQKKLFRQDGTPKYTPAEHREREAQLIAPVQEAAQKARDAIQEALAESDRDELITDFDPLLTLAGKQRDTVMVKQTIITSDVDAADLPTLARRLNAVAVHGDEVDKRLYVVHAQKRLKALQDELWRTKRQAPEGITAANQALRNLRESLVDKEAESKVKAAKYRRQRANDLSIHVMRRLNEATGKTEQAKHQFENRIRQF